MQGHELDPEPTAHAVRSDERKHNYPYALQSQQDPGLHPIGRLAQDEAGDGDHQHVGAGGETGVAVDGLAQHIADRARGWVAGLRVGIRVRVRVRVRVRLMVVRVRVRVRLMVRVWVRLMVRIRVRDRVKVKLTYVVDLRRVLRRILHGVDELPLPVVGEPLVSILDGIHGQ